MLLLLRNSTDLEPNSTQRTTLIVIAVYAVFIAVAWNVWGLRCVCLPFSVWATSGWVADAVDQAPDLPF